MYCVLPYLKGIYKEQNFFYLLTWVLHLISLTIKKSLKNYRCKSCLHLNIELLIHYNTFLLCVFKEDSRIITILADVVSAGIMDLQHQVLDIGASSNTEANSIRQLQRRSIHCPCIDNLRSWTWSTNWMTLLSALLGSHFTTVPSWSIRSFSYGIVRVEW